MQLEMQLELQLEMQLEMQLEFRSHAEFRSWPKGMGACRCVMARAPILRQR